MIKPEKKPKTKLDKIRELKMIFIPPTPKPEKDKLKKKEDKKELESKQNIFIHETHPKTKAMFVKLSKQLEPKESQWKWEDKRKKFYLEQQKKNLKPILNEGKLNFGRIQ